ncbi:MAG: hypothetical protein WC095_01075 [Candidatus Paceibacterota bacterium]
MNIQLLDIHLINFFKKISVPVARLSLFIIYFWFGFLKIIDQSPANPLVSDLLSKTLPFMSFELFIILFGLFEMLIGILFLVPKLERVVIPLLFIHMITTALPLFFLQQISWSRFMIPTLEGQYIIKNIALITCAIGIASHMKPLKVLK